MTDPKEKSWTELTNELKQALDDDVPEETDRLCLEWLKKGAKGNNLNFAEKRDCNHITKLLDIVGDMMGVE